MKKLILLATLISFNSYAVNESRYFERPLSCPLRFSQLSAFRDQVAMLVASLGNNCNQQAINQLNSSVSNLEGIVSSFNQYGSSDDAKSTTQYAKNIGQILGSINLITSNNSCFYDIRARGVLPVLADVVMSTSQFGLLIPNATGQAVAAGGFIAGSGIKIVNELIKKKFNFDRPEERRAFIQLNCAFFENRRVMEESGIFNPETEQFREELIQELRRERLTLLRSQRSHEKKIDELDELLATSLQNIPDAAARSLDPFLLRKLDEISAMAPRKPLDISEKLRQVSAISERLQMVAEGLNQLTLDKKIEPSRKLLLSSIEKVLPDFEMGGRAWTATIDEYENTLRGPIFAFISPVTEALRREIFFLESELDHQTAKKLSLLRVQIKEFQEAAWSVNLRLASVETKILSFEKSRTGGIFSDQDEGSSNAVEILEYYRELQKSILGKEGRDYLSNALKTGYNMKDGLLRMVKLMKGAKTQLEICSAAEKTRFAWAQYRYKVQEAHDFVATNMDLYRSSFRIGKERLKRATSFVLFQLDSVQDYLDGNRPESETVGDLMRDVNHRVPEVESLLQKSGCF